MRTQNVMPIALGAMLPGAFAPRAAALASPALDEAARQAVVSEQQDRR